MSNDAKRLFIGILADRDTQRAIAGHQLAWHWPSKPRLISPENFHLTLIFLGQVDAADEGRLRRSLASVVMEPMRLLLTTPDVFPGGVAILRPEPSAVLFDLHARVAAGVSSMGLPVDRMPWQPHVTLARGAAGCQPPVQRAVIAMPALQFSLVCSRPERTQSYEVVESWPASPIHISP